MLSVINFALAAPVVVQKREMHVSEAVDSRTDSSPLRRDSLGKWLANAADRTNALPIPRSSSGPWLELEPRQHYPIDSPEGSGGSKPLPLWDLNYLPLPSPTGQPPTNQLPTGEPSTSEPSTSKPPTSKPPTDEPHSLNPSSTSGNIDLNILPQDQGSIDDSHTLSPSPHGNAYLNLSPYQGQGLTDNSDR